MIRQFCTLATAAAALFASVGVAQADPLAEGPKTLAEATKGPSQVIVWEVADDDTTIYMMGTVHILDPKVTWKNADFADAWAKADTVYFEADVISPGALEGAAPLVMSLGFDASGKKLASYYDDDQQTAINSALSTFGVNLDALQTMRPWLAGIQVAQIALQSIGGSAEGGVETILGKAAQDEGKSMRFFETVSQQLEMLANGDDDAQARIFFDGIEDLINVEAYFAKLVGAWYKGDTDTLAEMIHAGISEAPEVAEALLYNRNEAWATEISSVMENEQGTFFVAVGAGHLGGEKSLQDYLAANGYQAIRFSAE